MIPPLLTLLTYHVNSEIIKFNVPVICTFTKKRYIDIPAGQSIVTTHTKINVKRDRGGQNSTCCCMVLHSYIYICVSGVAQPNMNLLVDWISCNSIEYRKGISPFLYSIILLISIRMYISNLPPL